MILSVRPAGDRAIEIALHEDASGNAKAAVCTLTNEESKKLAWSLQYRTPYEYDGNTCTSTLCVTWRTDQMDMMIADVAIAYAGWAGVVAMVEAINGRTQVVLQVVRTG